MTGDPNRPFEALPHRGPPQLQKGLRATTYKKWIEYSGTLVYGMLDPWEIVLLHLLYFMIFSLICFGIYHYLPQHIITITDRMQWYWYGDELVRTKL